MSVHYKTRIPHLYRYLAPIYDPIRPYWTQTISRGAEQYLEKWLKELVHPDSVILDLGCGPASNLKRLERLDLPFTHYVGLDLSSAMLTRHPTPTNRQASFILGDIWHPPFATESFDLILSTWAFSHLHHTLPVIQTMLHLLRPGGQLLIVCFARPNNLIGRILHITEPLFLMRCPTWEEISTWPNVMEAKPFLGGVNAVVRLHRK
ncbi:MAG: class I SAM-dependent methyltransferase [Chloroflexi bacterium]|nr:MAG: class I SAM-dependent methyltransferase [Chloroflexota bacterium]